MVIKVYFQAAMMAAWFFLASIICFSIMIWRWRTKRNINPEFASTFAWGLNHISGIRADIQGRENYEPGKPYVIVGNHQSELDLAFIGQSCPPNTVVIGKKELVYVPFFGILFVMTGNLVIQRTKRHQAVANLNELVSEIKRRGVSVFIFPEGTRNRTRDPLLPFKKGAFHMAIRAGVPILPVVCGRLTDHIDIGKGVLKAGVIPVKILPPIETQGMTDADTHKLSNQVREKMLEALRGLESRHP